MYTIFDTLILVRIVSISKSYSEILDDEVMNNEIKLLQLVINSTNISLLLLLPFEIHTMRQSCMRGGSARKPAGRSGPHDPTTMTTDLSCFPLSRVREYLIKWNFVITNLHQFTETQTHERIP